MRAFASSFSAWKMLERQEGIKVPHGLVFPLAVVEAIGRPHELCLVAEEHTVEPVTAFDAVFISVLDTRCMVDAAKHFAKWRMPLFRADRGSEWPLVWAGGQGLHNPLPMADVADLIVVGDAEESLPALLILHASSPSRRAFLSHAAAVPGVFVPSVHDRRVDVIEQQVASDIGITIREEITVSNDGSRRIEIARGCKYKCTFCSLGWRTPVRENSAEDVLVAIKKSPKKIHLQAGDAESHSGIDAIREGLRAHGGSDQGWTGRLDSLFENPDQTVPGQKRYAFGVEGISHRLRAAVGKAYLTDERLIDDTVRFFSSIEGDGKGRAMWHVISGLPTERHDEVVAFMTVIKKINDARRGKTARNLTIGWQPFSPLPGTPMQWCAAGGGARKMSSMVSSLENLPWVPIRQQGGRTDDMSKLCSVLVRSDERGALLLSLMNKKKVSVQEAEELTGSTSGQIDPDASLPWDFVRTRFDKSVLRKAYDVMNSRLKES